MRFTAWCDNAAERVRFAILPTCIGYKAEYENGVRYRGARIFVWLEPYVAYAAPFQWARSRQGIDASSGNICWTIGD
ncbi:MAG TPA: hypothetical protein VN665_03570 [Candidatus Paceibacterota bacterium]|nr:hypothetical protein [Candidatus Paceibacterota bacterium]